jgi:hypothetical protein
MDIKHGAAYFYFSISGNDPEPFTGLQRLDVHRYGASEEPHDLVRLATDARESRSRLLVYGGPIHRPTVLLTCRRIVPATFHCPEYERNRGRGTNKPEAQGDGPRRPSSRTDRRFVGQLPCLEQHASTDGVLLVVWQCDGW